jgi:hypothetical protein
MRAIILSLVLAFATLGATATPALADHHHDGKYAAPTWRGDTYWRGGSYYWRGYPYWYGGSYYSPGYYYYPPHYGGYYYRGYPYWGGHHDRDLHHRR